jgi:pilus assembly protein FimV
MQKKRRQMLVKGAAWALAVIVAPWLAGAANAAGFVSNSAGATLGQPLDFSVQVRLDAGAEPLAAECVSAEVTAGDVRVLPGNVRTVIESQNADLARLRVQTTQAIDEPVIGVNLTVGCVARLTRRFVILADPPSLASQPLAPTNAPVSAPMPALAAAVPLASARAATSSGTSTANPQSRKTVAAVASRTQPRAQMRVAAKAAEPKAPALSSSPANVASALAPAATAASGVRLKLDFEDTRAATAAKPSTATPAVATPAPPSNEAVDQALVAVAQASLAAQAAATAASAAQERILVLERTVEQLRAEAKSSRDVAGQLRDRLVQADGAGSYTQLLLALAALLGGLAAWLAWRLGRLQGQRQQGWTQAGAAAVAGSAAAVDSRANSSAYPATVAPSKTPTQPGSFASSRFGATPFGATPFGNTDAPSIPPLSSVSRSGRSSVPAWPPAAPADPWADVTSGLEPGSQLSSAVALDSTKESPVQRTEPLARDLVNGAARDVSIEELIDLEQQAEFFIVLGQDDAAIDLLVDHLRSTGGSSPLPYLKLLEIYHRRGEHASYERMRARFNHRFNAYAPEWGVDLTHGRSLDSYPSVIPRLEQVWPRPLDAMAELEALLFRKSRGELFELPAYREVLFLYSLARDLLDREAADTGSVDLLLPLADGTEFSSTAPAPFVDADTFHLEPRRDYDDRPTAPVDFDLTQPPPQVSIFDTVEESPRGRRR